MELEIRAMELELEKERAHFNNLEENYEKVHTIGRHEYEL